MNTEIRNIDSTNNLTRVESSCNVNTVIRFADLEKRLDQQYNEDVKQLKKNYTEQNKLRPSILRFNDLDGARRREKGAWHA